MARVTSILAAVAAAVWLGGLLSLGAIAAPVIFAMVSWPANADAMTLVFQRFDRLAMSCAALMLGAEAARSLARIPFAWSDRLRAGATTLAAALAVAEGIVVSPRIAALHRSGAIRGVGVPGEELARLHDFAEWGGKVQLLLLVGVVALHVTTNAPRPPPPSRVGSPGSAAS
jgi:hypothetical protein